MHFVRAAVAQLQPAARARVLASAGVPEGLLDVAKARVVAQAFSAVWLAVSRELDDEFFGLDRRRMKVGSFALLCHAVLANANLDRALSQILRGFGVLLDDVSGRLLLDDKEAVVRLESRIVDAGQRRFADETLLVMIHGLACWLVGKRIPIDKAEFAYPQPEHVDEYRVMYSEELAFDAPSTAIRFDAKLLRLPVVQRQDALKVFLRTAPQSVFLKYKNEYSVSARLRRYLRRFIGQPDWPDLDVAAAQFNVSVTTLRRHLALEFASYQGLKDEVRRDAAIHCLCSTGMSVGEVAASVGFQEVSAFRRAFKAWSGVQPSEYRRRGAGPPGDGRTGTATKH